MNRRASYLTASAVMLLAVLGSFVSFSATGSQTQFAALNAVFLLLAGVAASVGTLLGISGDSKPTVPWMGVAGTIFLASALLSSLFSGRLATALLGEPTSLLGLASLLATAMLALFSRKSTVLGEVLSGVAPIVVTIQGLWALLQPKNVVDAGHGGYANSSALGLALVVLLPWMIPDDETLLATGAENRRRERVVRWVSVAFALFVAYVTKSRIAVVLMLGTLSWYALARTRITPRLKHIALAATAVAGSLIVGIMVALERAGRLPFEFLTIRYQLWSTAMSAFLRRPVLGWGADGFFSAGASVTAFDGPVGIRPLIFADGTTDPHNILVLIAVSFGLLGLVAALATFVGVLVRARTRGAYESFDAASVSLVAATLALLTMPVPIEVLPLLGITGGLAARIKGPIGKHDIESRTALAPSVRAGVVATAVLCMVFAAQAAANAALGPVTYFAPAGFDRASSLSRVFVWDPFLQHQVNASFGAMLDGEEIRRTKPEWERSRGASGVVLDDHNPYYALSHAQAMWNSGRPPAEVFAAYAEALRRYPAFPSAHAELALLYASTGQAQAAQRELSKVYVFGAPEGRPWGTAVKGAQDALDRTVQ